MTTVPLLVLVTPSNVNDALASLVSVPPLVKLLNVAVPFWTMVVSLNVVTPLKVAVAPASTVCVPLPRRKPPLTVVFLYSAAPLKARMA